jgi:multicomponent Na+:H+ antiporter subunit C
MTLALALVGATLFGTGAYLLLKRDLFRVVAGIILISNAVTFFIVAAGLTRGAAPIYPLPEGRPVSDPLVQAMALTAIVITFGVTAVLLSLVYRVYTDDAAGRADPAAGERRGDRPPGEDERC